MYIASLLASGSEGEKLDSVVTCTYRIARFFKFCLRQRNAFNYEFTYSRVQYVLISYYEISFLIHDVIINLQIYTQSTLPSRRHKRAIQEGRGTRVRSREGLKAGQK